MVRAADWRIMIEVVGSTPGCFTAVNDFGQVVHTCLLSPSSIIWYGLKVGDVLRMEGIFSEDCWSQEGSGNLPLSLKTAATAVPLSAHPSPLVITTKLAAAILGGLLFGLGVLPAQYCPRGLSPCKVCAMFRLRTCK